MSWEKKDADKTFSKETKSSAANQPYFPRSLINRQIPFTSRSCGSSMWCLIMWQVRDYWTFSINLRTTRAHIKWTEKIILQIISTISITAIRKLVDFRTEQFYDIKKQILDSSWDVIRGPQSSSIFNKKIQKCTTFSLLLIKDKSRTDSECNLTIQIIIKVRKSFILKFWKTVQRKN